MANFTQSEITLILDTFENIKSRMNVSSNTSLDPNDKPIADGYAMMAKLLQDKLANDKTLTETEKQETTYVMTWFLGAEKVNRGEGSFSTMIRTYSDMQGKLRYGSEFGADLMQQASNKIGINAFSEIALQAGENKSNPVPLLDMKFIAEKDAVGVGEVLFNRDSNDTAHHTISNSAWSGVSLFSVLGNDQTYRILGSGQTSKFDTFTDLRDSMFLLESFRHAFAETFKSSAIKASIALATATNVFTQPIAVKIINEIVKEMNLFSSPVLIQNFVDELTNYQSTDGDKVSLQWVADSFLLAMVNGHTAYNDLKNLIYFGNYRTLNFLNQYFSMSSGENQINEDNFISQAYSLFQSHIKADGLKQIEWLPKNQAELEKQSLEQNHFGLANRFALKNLGTVALVGFNFNKFNQNGELDLYSPTNPNGMTETYIQKRAEMLSALLEYNTQNTISEQVDFYHDFESNQQIGQAVVTGQGVLELNEKILFGTEQADTEKLIGSDKADYLFGGAGNDVLKGGAGDDYMEGGKDSDSYYVQGEDTIFDSDMKGQVFFEKSFGGKDIQAKYFAFVSEGVWKSTNEKGKDYGNMQANRVGDDLKIKSGRHSTTIKDFFLLSEKDKKGNWHGLDMVVKEEPVDPFVNTKDYHQNGHQLLRLNYDYVNRLGVDASISEHEEARLGKNHNIKQYGSHVDDMMYNTQNGSAIAFLGSGNDWAYGGYGYDWLYGEDGNDMLFGSALAALIARPSLYSQNGKEANVPTGLLDRDYIVGGAGSDLIFGVDGDDTIHTDQDRSQGSIAGYLIEQSAALSILRGDLAAGGKGNDHIFGSIARDLLTGGAGADRIFGGAGSDVLIGDGELFPNIQRGILIDNAEERINGSYSDLTSMWRVQHLPFDPKTDKMTDSKHKINQNAWDIRFDFKAGKYTYESVVGKRLNEHHVKEGAGNDSLWGGQGTDLLIGQYGNDYLDGGAGNDVLWGDDYENPTSYQNHHGQNHDTLIAGSGLDYLYGGYGYDKYLFKKADLNHVQYDKKFIKDTDHSGHIMMNGVTLHSVKWTADAYLPNTWVNKEKDWALKLEGNHLIFSSPNKTAFNSTITIQDFKNKAFGLDLFSENDLNELVRNVSSTSSETQDDTQTYTEYNTDSHINTSPHYLDTSNRYEII